MSPIILNRKSKEDDISFLLIIDFRLCGSDEMKNLLFSLLRVVVKEKFTGYSFKSPVSLTSQFPDRVGKTEAVEAYHKLTKLNINTELFPTGNSSFFQFISCQISVCFYGSPGTVLS